MSGRDVARGVAIKKEGFYFLYDTMRCPCTDKLRLIGVVVVHTGEPGSSLVWSLLITKGSDECGGI